MTWSAVVPETAWRVVRTAAGRRALHVMLLMSGVFVLGVLCGERAQAAEGVPSPRDVTGQVVAVAPEHPREEPAASATAVREPSASPQGLEGDRGGEDSPAVREAEAGGSGLGLRSVAEGVAGGVVRPVETRVVRPVVDVVEKVTDGLGAVARAEVPPLEALTDPPALPRSPGLTAPSGLPVPSGLTSPSDLTGLPGRVVPTGTLPQTPPPSTHPALPAAPETTPGAAPSGATPEADRTRADTGPATVAYGPLPGAYGASGTRSTTHLAVDRTAPAPAAATPDPAHQAPTGDPDGSLGTGAGADHGTPRHGDAHAVTPHHRIAFRLVPGALARAEAAGTRDRYRDIPVSPA
ncbi:MULTISPECIES: hypothetical protein [Streptomyces rochei group]|uniref:Secreted protein n=1 Tax=Streptomyces plicatus TaxID=1922 RepID=A0ABW1Y3E9_STRPL|nr:hypothetical protein [Streptomyces plicatus]